MDDHLLTWRSEKPACGQSDMAEALGAHYDVLRM